MLEGIKVLTIENFVAGPLTSRYLSDLGADVIKIENVQGGGHYRQFKGFDETNDKNETPQDINIKLAQFDRGKKSIALDLKSRPGKEVFIELAKDTDIIVENLKPGAMKKLGLGYEDILQVNDEIIFCSISGYGETGPLRNYPAVDGLIQARSGFTQRNSTEADGLFRSGMVLADLITAIYSSQSILAALVSKLQSGDGTFIDISMMDALLSLFPTELAEYSATGQVQPGRRDSFAPAGIFSTADKPVYLIVLNKSWNDFCKIIGKEEYLDDDRYSTPESRVNNIDILNNNVEKILLQKNHEYWVDKFVENDILISPINTPKEAFESEQVKSRNIIKEVFDQNLGAHLQLNYPGKFSPNDLEIPTDIPRYGEDTKTELRRIGISEEELQYYYDKNIVNDYRNAGY